MPATDRKRAAVRALLLLRATYGVRAFTMVRNAPDGTRYRSLDTGKVHGPRRHNRYPRPMGPM